LPDLPAYVPCPVDVASMNPFTAEGPHVIAWSEVELIPHAQSMSNITLVGEVLDVEVVKDSSGGEATQITLFIPAHKQQEEETIVVHCYGSIRQEVQSCVQRHSTVYVNGVIRLIPQLDQASNKYYIHPVVKVALPAGSIFVLE